MAISVPNTLAELQFLSKKLGIYDQIKGTKKDGSKSKEDYIIPIRKKILQDRYNGDTPLYLSLMLDNIKSPMLSKRFDEVNEDIQRDIWSSDEWYFEEKINGIRCFLIKQGDNLKVYSREINKSDLLPIEIPLLFDTSGLSNIQDDFILDCELTSNNINALNILNGYGLYSENVTQSLEELLLKLNPILSKRILRESDFRFIFNVLDCLYINEWIMFETLEKRKIQCKSIVETLNVNGISCRLVNSTNENKEWFYNSCLKSGYEGCICKRGDSIYVPDTTRKKDGWIKIKPATRVEKEFTREDEVYDTIDGFITGFTPGEDYIESLEISAYVDGVEKSICCVCDLSDFLKNYVTARVDNIVTIKPNLLGSVVELDGLLSGILRFRFDRNSSDCKVSGTLLKNIKNYKCN